MEIGTHQVRIELMDANNDRPNDALTTIIEDSFEITLEMKNKEIILCQ